MKKECDSAPETSKGDMEFKLSKYNRELNEIKKKVKRKEEMQERFYSLNSLTRGYTNKKGSTSAERKEMAKDKNKTLMNGVKKLEEAMKSTEDTHQVSLNIMGTMQDQRVQLQNASGKIQEIKGNAHISAKSVKEIERKEFVYKGLLMFIIGLLLLTITSLLYIKFTRFR